ncbi:MAG: hypothetical protein ACI3ZN_03570 [Candidatus Cryptobacteroides sp.]
MKKCLKSPKKGKKSLEIKKKCVSLQSQMKRGCPRRAEVHIKTDAKAEQQTRFFKKVKKKFASSKKSLIFATPFEKRV